MVGRLLGGSCGSIFSFLCHGCQTFSGVRVAQSLVLCFMVGRLLVGFLWLNLQFSVSWLVDFQWAACVSIFSFLCHGWQTFSGVRVAQSLHFCVMVGQLFVGFMWLNLQFSVSLLVDFQWGSCGSIFSFLCHGWQTFSRVRMAQSLVLCFMVGRLLVGFAWLNLYFSVSWLVDFQCGSCGSIVSFLCHGRQIFSGVHVAQSSFLYHGWQTLSGVRVDQSLVFCVVVGKLLAGFEWLNLQFSVSWLVDFQWGSGGSIFSFLCQDWQIFSGVRLAQSLVFCVMVDRFLMGFVWFNLQFSVSWQVDFQWGSCCSIFSFLCHCSQVYFQWGSCGPIFSFLCHGWQTFSGIRVAQSLVFCVMVGRLLVGFVWLNLYFFVMVGRLLGGFVWLNLQFSLIVCRLLVGFVWLNVQFSASWFAYFQRGSCVSIFRFLRHGWETFSGVRVAQTLVFCVMVGRLLVGFVWLNLQFSASWLVDFQWGSCGSIFSFLCHGRQTFSGVRVAQSLVFCVMVGRLLVGFVLLNLQFSVSWQVDFQWGSCGPIFGFLCHGWQTFSGIRVAQSLVFCVMVGRLLGGLVWLKLQCSVSWQVDFQGGSCGSIFCFLRHGWQTFSGVREAQSLVLCQGWRLLGGFVWLNLQFSLIVGRLLVGFVWLNVQFSASWFAYLQWGSCVSIFRFLHHGWETFSGVRVAQTLVFCVMVGRLLVGFVWLNLQFSASWLVDFQWGSCVSIFCFLCHGWQTFSGLRVSQSLVFCVIVGRLLVGFVWLNLQFSVMFGRLLVGFVWLNLQISVSWQVYFQWGSCGSIFSFLCHGRQTFSEFRVAQSLVFCVMVGRLLVGFVLLNLQFSVSWLVDFQWDSCGSIFSLLCHGRQTFSWVRVAHSLVFCVMVGRLLVGFVWLNLQISVSWQVYFQWGSCGSIFCFLCHGWQTFSGVRVAQSLVFCGMVWHRPPINWILMPYPWHFDPLPMVYRPPYPWYFDPPFHGNLTPSQWYIEPPIHGILTPLPISLLEMRGSKYHGVQCSIQVGAIFNKGGQYTMDEN